MITCELQELIKYVRFVRNFVGVRSLNPIYRLMWLETTEFTLRMRGMDGIIRTETEAGANIGSQLSVLIDPNLLATILGTLEPGGDIAITKKRNKLLINQGDTERWVSTANPDDFPPDPMVQDTTKFTVPLSQFLGIIDRVGFAKSETRDRPILQGLCLDADADRILAGDGLRIAGALLEHDIPLGAVLSPQVWECLRSLTYITDVDEVVLTYGEAGWFKLETDAATVWINRISGEYPTVAYKAIDSLLEKPDGTVLTFDNEVLLKPLELACTYGDLAIEAQESKALTLEVKDSRLWLKMQTTAGGMDDLIEYCQVEGPDSIIYMDPSLLRQALEASPLPGIRMTLWGPGSPALIQAKDQLTAWAVVQTPLAPSKEILDQWEHPVVKEEDDNGTDDF